MLVGYRFVNDTFLRYCLCRVQVPQEHLLGTLMSCTGLPMIISRDTLSGTGSPRTFLGYSYVMYRFAQ